MASLMKHNDTSSYMYNNVKITLSVPKYNFIRIPSTTFNGTTNRNANNKWLNQIDSILTYTDLEVATYWGRHEVIEDE